jgi:hypothetical protein
VEVVEIVVATYFFAQALDGLGVGLFAHVDLRRVDCTHWEGIRTCSATVR